MIQNLGSHPKINCKIITEEVIIMGFLCFTKKAFIVYVLYFYNFTSSFHYYIFSPNSIPISNFFSVANFSKTHILMQFYAANIFRKNS
jgi:hypothetical protein